MWIIQALPSGGIYIFASQLHTHLAGRGVQTVLVRGGSELEVVQEDRHFSAHYQVSLSRYQLTRRSSGQRFARWSAEKQTSHLGERGPELLADTAALVCSHLLDSII